MANMTGLRCCDLCGKPFNQDLAYKRHVSYCQRRKHHPKARKRPCRACQIAKVKCVAAEPCRRCLQKGLSCSYERKDIDIDIGFEESLSNDVLVDQDVLATRNEDEWTVQNLVLDSNSIHPVIPYRSDWDDHNDQAFPEIAPDLLDTSLMLLDTSILPSSLPQPYHLNIEPNQDWSTIFHLDPYTSSLLPNEVDKWVLRPSPMQHPLAQNHSHRLIRMLRSIPRMMVRRENFPPFIHSHWQHDLPGPLTNCMTIARLFCTRTSANSGLVWNVIRLEQERLARETYDFTKDDLMAALQTYLVYMIMRAEDDTSQTAGDVPMLFSLKALTDWCYHLFGGYPIREETTLDPKMTWEKWIFAESQRRCALLYFLIGRVFNVFTGNVCPCTSDPSKLPLPAPRNVWEARSEQDWADAYREMLSSNRVTTFGELMEEVRMPTRKMEEWQGGMDYLGSLLESAIGTF